MKVPVIVVLLLIALLLPGGLIGLVIARRFYRRVYLSKGMEQLRVELGLGEPKPPASAALRVLE